MEDKTFDLLAKMYAEMQEMKSNMATKHDIIRIENKMDDNFKALYDGYQLTYEKLNILESKVDDISAKVDKHDVEIRVIKGSKKARSK